MSALPRLIASTCVVALALVFETACAGGRPVQQVSATPPDQTQLWQAPDDISSRDLFLGSGGTTSVPPRESFVFVAVDTTGKSPGFDVKDAKGREWSVKQGPEAQTEVVASRVLWAIGFHQPPTHYVDQWTMTGSGAGAKEGPQVAGRFRPERPDVETVVGDWAWTENPFVGTRAFGGLIVANLILNSWDWKTSNNKIYETKTAQTTDGARLPARRYVVRDLGASLGKTSYPSMLKWLRMRGFGQGSRNDLEDFESQGFLLPSEDGAPRFDYRGIYDPIVDVVTFEDVRWTCELLSRLTDKQWDDAFRAAGYSPEVRARYIRKMKEKTQQGLRAGADPSAVLALLTLEDRR